jgi:hypothetical protein
MLSGASKRMIKAGVGMIAIAIAVKILASAVRDFSSLSWEEMVKGLVASVRYLPRLPYLPSSPI